MSDLERWLAHLQDAHNVSAHTLDAYGRDVRRFLDHLNGAEPANQTLSTLSRYLQLLAGQGHKSATLIRATAALRNFYLYLVFIGAVSDNPAAELKAPEAILDERAVPAADEVTPEMAETAAAMVGEMSETPWIQARDRAVFLLMVDHGLKIGEVLSLTLGDYRAGMLTVGADLDDHARLRTFEPRAAAKSALDSYLKRDPFDRPPTRRLFVGLRGGPLNPGVVQRQLRRLRGLLGLPSSMTPEALRQAFAKRRVREGRALSQLQAELGHRHLVSTTKIVGDD